MILTFVIDLNALGGNSWIHFSLSNFLWKFQSWEVSKCHRGQPQAFLISNPDSVRVNKIKKFQNFSDLLLKRAEMTKFLLKLNKNFQSSKKIWLTYSTGNRWNQIYLWRLGFFWIGLWFFEGFLEPSGHQPRKTPDTLVVKVLFGSFRSTEVDLGKNSIARPNTMMKICLFF